MQRLVRWYLKTGIAYLIVGLVLGGIMIVRREILGAYPSPYWVSAHTHVLLVGFVLMMILGVALWMFPRPERGQRKMTILRVASVLATSVAGKGPELSSVGSAACGQRTIEFGSAGIPPTAQARGH